MMRSAGQLVALALVATHLSVATASPYRYPEQRNGMRQPFEYPDEMLPLSAPEGISFSGFHTDRMVLQRGASTQAAIYGSVTGTVSAATKVSLTVSEDASKYEVTASIMQVGSGNLTWKGLLRPHPEYGGNVTVTATCDGCSGNTSATITDLTFGDVWFCSGQSNMELPMQHGLTRNRTYELLALGQYSNIRTFKQGTHRKLPDASLVDPSGALWVLPPPAPPSCPLPDGTPTCYQGWQSPNASTVDEFSAACWFTAQELTDIAVDQGKPAPILGMVQSAWGGTEITSWIKNSSGACRNASGTGPQKTSGGGGPDFGALWNGMVAPFINSTIFGALWYQGENNVHDCVGAGQRDSGIDACGNVDAKTGYACSTHNLVTSWREQWSVVPDTTSSMFPFGIVSLAAGTSEGHGKNMGNFRHAQTASYGFLPGPPGSGLESTFIAQGYDAGDPGTREMSFGTRPRVQCRPDPEAGPGKQQCSDEFQGGFSGPQAQVDSPYQGFYDAPFEGRVGWSAGGHQRFTHQYMGGLHPRAKQTIGRRLALGAAAVAYNQSVPFTGPKLKNCSVLPEGAHCFPGEKECNLADNAHGFSQRQITINFDEELLGSDAVLVWPTSPDTEGLTMIAMYNCLNGTCIAGCERNATCVESCAVLNTPVCRMGLPVSPLGPRGNGGNPTQYQAGHMFYKTGRTVSPMEVQLNDSLWMPASISFNADKTGGDPINRDCKLDPKSGAPECTNWTRVQGWSSVVAMAPTAIPLGCGQGYDKRGYPQPCPPAEKLRPGQLCQNCSAHFQITGVRYAWAENPCCGGNLGPGQPCPVNSCPISTYNSTLPAVPFLAKIKYENDTGLAAGQCECTSPQTC